VFSSVAGEVAVVTVDHRQARAHIAGEIEGRDPGTEREGREGVAEIVDSPSRLDPSRFLGLLPVPVAEVVQINSARARANSRSRRTMQAASSIHRDKLDGVTDPHKGRCVPHLQPIRVFGTHRRFTGRFRRSARST
jgi:hypothetical protein